MTDKAFLQAIFLLFGRKLAKVPPFPVNDNIIKFNFANNQWELAFESGGAGEANTSSNVGAGLGWALPKVGVDLPFKTFIATAPLSIVSNPTDITISIAGQVNTFILGVFQDTALPRENTFIGFFSNLVESTETDTTGFLSFAFTVKRYTLRVNSSNRGVTTTFSVRDDGVSVPNTSIAVPALTTGSFDTGAISETIGANSLINLAMLSSGGSGNISEYSQLVECEK